MSGDPGLQSELFGAGVDEEEETVGFGSSPVKMEVPLEDGEVMDEFGGPGHSSIAGAKRRSGGGRGGPASKKKKRDEKEKVSRKKKKQQRVEVSEGEEEEELGEAVGGEDSRGVENTSDGEGENNGFGSRGDAVEQATIRVASPSNPETTGNTSVFPPRPSDDQFERSYGGDTMGKTENSNEQRNGETSISQQFDDGEFTVTAVTLAEDDADCEPP